MSVPGNASLALRLVAMTAAMFAFGFALVPLYDVFCQITGLGGKTGGSAAVVAERPDESRLVTVEFMASVNEHAPWDFEPVVERMQVHPGKLYDTSYLAANLTGRELVGQAVPSVAPQAAARHFRKTECFCFTAQPFGPEEVKDMPVRFMVDRELPPHIDTVTLSYTFFRTDAVAGSPAGTQRDNDKSVQ